MEGFLKNIVSNAKNNNELETKDWNCFPLPTLPRENLALQGGIVSIKPKVDNSIINHINSLKKQYSADEDSSKLEESHLTNAKRMMAPSQWFKIDKGTNLSSNENVALSNAQKSEIMAMINKNQIKKPLMIKKKGGKIILPDDDDSDGTKKPSPNSMHEEISGLNKKKQRYDLNLTSNLGSLLSSQNQKTNDKTPNATKLLQHIQKTKVQNVRVI